MKNPIPRPIDHLVLPVSDLAAARARLEQLGFTVAPDARHPFGTGNACVFFENWTYLEPLAIIDPDRAREAVANGLFFVSRALSYFHRHGPGFAMLALKSEDAEADQRAYESVGISAGPPFRFTRGAVMPSGEMREIGVVLAYAADPIAAEMTLFACQHLAPDVLWQPAYASHRNTAIGVTGVAAVAENPADFHVFLKGATGQNELRATSFGIEANLGSACLQVLTPAGFQARYGSEPPDSNGGMLLAAFEIAVRDLDEARACLEGHARPFGELLIVQPSAIASVMAFRSAP